MSVPQNIVHLLFGVAGLLMGRAQGRSEKLPPLGRRHLPDPLDLRPADRPSSAANFVPVNSADNWLHLVLGLGMVALALLLNRRPARATTDRT